MFRILLTLFLSINAVQQPLIAIPSDSFHSENYLMMDMEDGTVLFENNGYASVHPASITKVLTLITAIEQLEIRNISMDDTYTIPEGTFDDVPWDASIANFRVGDTLSVRDILFGIQMPSGADATAAISRFLTDSTDGLVDLMNSKAKDIGMENSTFINTSGLDHDNHLSTPYDLALLVKYAYQNESFKELYTTISYTTSPTDTYPNGIPLTNKSLEAAKGTLNTIQGAKSGHTDAAERALSSVATKDNMTLIFISTNAPEDETIENTNILDAITAYNRVFNAFQKVVAIPKDTTIEEIKIKYSKDPFSVSFLNNINVYLPLDLTLEDLDIQITNLQESYIAPIEANTEMANVTISYSNKEVFNNTLTNATLIDTNPEQVFYEYAILFGQIIGIAVAIIVVLILIIRAINRRRYRRYVQRRRQRG